MPTVAKSTSPICKFRMRHALSYVEKHYRDRELSLAVVDREVGVSACYLRRLFALECHIGFRTYLKRLRMSCAVDLLNDPRLSVKQVASFTGYKHTSGFDRDFRRFFGKRPTEFRVSL